MAKIYLVAGHGGMDSGAVAFGRTEKADVLRVALDVGAKLSAMGHEIRYNRTTDVDTDYYGYVAECNRFGADFCASFHRNACGGGANGYETCIYSDTGKTKVFADSMNAGMERLGFKNRGSKIRPDLMILNSTAMDCGLCELGFVDNAGDNELFDKHYGEIVDLAVNSILRAVGASAPPAPSKVDWEPRITDLYVTQLGRLPDVEGLEAYKRILTNEDKSFEEVAAEIVDSLEGKRYFIANLYKDLLHRDPDPAGLDNWVRVLEEKEMSRGEIFKAFINSDEYKSTRS